MGVATDETIRSAEADKTATTTSPEGSQPAAAVAGAAVGSSSQSHGEEEAPGCSICTEDFERGQDVRVLPCQHSFHPACIDPWLLNVSGTCPLCLSICAQPANEMARLGHLLMVRCHRPLMLKVQKHLVWPCHRTTAHLAAYLASSRTF